MKRTIFGNSQQNVLGVLFHVKQNSRLSKRECKLFKEDDIRIWSNIEKLVVFKDQLDSVVFIGVNGVVSPNLDACLRSTAPIKKA